MASSFSGSSTTTLTPRCILAFCKLKSRQAIFAFSIRLGIAVETRHERPQINANYTHSIQTLLKFFIRKWGKLI